VFIEKIIDRMLIDVLKWKWLVICFVTSQVSCYLESDDSKTAVVTVDTDVSVNCIEDDFLSFTIDSSIFQPDVRWYRFNFTSPKVQTLMKSLSLALLRVGGSSSDWLFFNKPLDVISSLKLKPKANVMTKKDVANFVQLTRSTGTRLVFDLNLQFRFGSQWDPSNAIELLTFCSEMKFCESIDWELGNEPEYYGGHQPDQIQLKPGQISNDFWLLKSLLGKYDNCRNSAIVGADVGRPSSTLGNQIFREVVNSTGGFLKAATFHHYYFGGNNATVEDYINPKYFSNLAAMIDVSRRTVAKTRFPNVTLWLGETSSAYNSGTPNISDRFVAGFLWMEKLGISAAMGIKLVMRQTFCGGNYALIDLDLNPNPDYWISWIHKQLIGRLVFDVTVVASGAVNATRVYAHCTNTDRSRYKTGALTVFALNVNRNLTQMLTFTGALAKQVIHVYLLTPDDDDPDGILSKWIQLNGERLVMPSENTMPDLKPVILPAGSPLKLPPLTLGYFVFPDAGIELCSHLKCS
jgi:heparanase